VPVPSRSDASDEDYVAETGTSHLAVFRSANGSTVRFTTRTGEEGIIELRWIPQPKGD
jgi:hypothetical protein